MEYTYGIQLSIHFPTLATYLPTHLPTLPTYQPPFCQASAAGNGMQIEHKELVKGNTITTTIIIIVTSADDTKN